LRVQSKKNEKGLAFHYNLFCGIPQKAGASKKYFRFNPFRFVHDIISKLVNK
jgi:hypothetical protein